jgi:hypothetical protein
MVAYDFLLWLRLRVSTQVSRNEDIPGDRAEHRLKDAATSKALSTNKKEQESILIKPQNTTQHNAAQHSNPSVTK